MPAPLSQLDLVVHATHEAGVKVGGIGAVLEGLLGASTYNEHVSRTILVGAIDASNREQMDRLLGPRNQLEILYSGFHSERSVESNVLKQLQRIEHQHQIKLIYGTRAFGLARHEILLVDGQHADTRRLNAYKASLYGHFGIQSDRYDSHPEYNLHINAAEATYYALQAIAGDTQATIVAHEFMGMPLCYSAMIHASDRYRTIFYGHEVATVRPIVEAHPGHDTMFYNVLIEGLQSSRYLEDIFGDQSHLFKHALIRPVAAHCDNIFAVGDWVVREMRFLGPRWAHANIDLVYNGVPSYEISLDQKLDSRARLVEYCTSLLGYEPDYVFTHVTRFVPSKGLWRDVRVMEQLAPLLRKHGKSAVLFVLSTIIPEGRPPKAIYEMEARYGWPVTHREEAIHMDGQQVPDLISHEVPFYYAVREFNQAYPATSIVLVNQFGWSQERCGKRMPADMAFPDIRQGSDVEFGQSIYEPFGIAQVEPLSFGALCVVSNICGCVGFLDKVGGLDKPNVIVADYTDTGLSVSTIQAALSIDRERRDQIEAAQARTVAQAIASRLPKTQAETRELIRLGYLLSQKMSWQTVAHDYLIPGLKRAWQT
jgi:glycosyltransferase involved in cell wall biosynthesis